MDGWPRIPNPGGGSGKSPRTTGTSLPAPGSTVVANVEDELGDGMYSLRWAGQKIHVSSRSPLAKGQALLLKSETSPEGKPRLVVVGPAPEQTTPTGRIIYGPNIGKKQSPEQQAQQRTAANLQSRNAALSQSRIGGNIVDTDSRAGRPEQAAADRTGQTGGQMAAGVAKAAPLRAGDPTPGLIGLVLEPLPDFEDAAKRLLEAAKKEAEQLEKQQAAETEKAEEGEEKTETSETDGEENAPEEAGEETKKNRKDLLRPAAPGQAGQAGAGQTGKPGTGNALAGNAAAAAGAGQPQPAGQGRIAGQSPSASGQSPAQPPNTAPTDQTARPGQAGQPPDAPSKGQSQPPPGNAAAPVQPPAPDQPTSSGQPSTPPQQSAPPAQPGATPSVPQNPPAQTGSPQPAPPLPPAQAGSSSATPLPPPVQAGASPAAPPSQSVPSSIPQTPPPAGAQPGGAPQSSQPADPTQMQPPRVEAARPAPIVIQDGGPVVPELPDMPTGNGKPAPQQQPPSASGASATPAPQPSAPGTPPQTQPNSPAAAPGQPSVLPGQLPAARPGVPAAAVPQPLPGTLPPPTAQDQSGVSPARPGGQATPQPLPGTPPPQPPAPGAPAVPAPATPAPQPSAPGQPPATPGQPVSPSGQPGGQTAPQPLPGTPLAPTPTPAAPGASQPAGAPGTAPAADAPSPAQPVPPPAVPGRPVPPPGQQPAAPGTIQPAPQPGRPGGQSAPQPLPGAPAAHAPQPGTPVAEDGGPIIPDIPVDGDVPPPQAQTRPSAPSAPGASPPAAAQPNGPSTPVPQAPTPPPPPAYPGAYPRPGTATYPRPTPQQSYAHSVTAANGASAAPGTNAPESTNPANAASPENSANAAAPAPKIKPEMLLREALGQMVGAAEIPLGDPAADAARLAPGNKMPEAVLDKAAAILLRGAGLTPDPETMEAAKALVANNVPVDRDNVQALLTAAAGIGDADEREAMLRAAARLLSKDIPLSPPLVAGMADVMSRRATAHRLMEAASQALSPDASLPEAEPLMAGARELLDMLHVDLGRSDAPAALERALSTFGREALGQALALVETSAQAALENNPRLQKIDQALTAILGRLQPEMEQTAPPPQAQPVQTQQTPPSAVPQANSEDPVPPAPASRPINAYLNAPKALPIEEMLKKLPPMPKVVSLGTQAPAIPPNLANAAAQAGAPALPPSTAQQILAQMQAANGSDSAPRGAPPESPTAPATPELPEPLDPEQIFRQAEALRRQSGVMNKLGSLFQIPGLNRQELELLRPGGFLDSFLNSGGGADRPEAAQTKADAEKLIRELMSPDARTAERALRELPQRESSVLRETAARLTQMESETLRADPLMNKLSDAATSLRDLGRQLLAVKAENLAGQDRTPGVMLAEIPFRLNDDAGDGRMQMFYRRGKKKGDGWSSRVILDLNTTRMGPVLGDMRFFGQDMTLNMFVDRQEAADYLTASAEELTENLAVKGFRVKMKFMVLPPPPKLDAERPVIAGEGVAEQGGSPSGGVRRTPGRLDIEL